MKSMRVTIIIATLPHDRSWIERHPFSAGERSSPLAGTEPCQERRLSLETVFIVKAAPLRVWTHLSDLSGLKRWHPRYAVENMAPDTGSFTLLCTSSVTERPIALRGTIVAFERPSLITWRAVYAGLIAITERYELEEQGSGTRISHSYALTGVGGRLLGPFIRGRMYADMRHSDEAFARYFTKSSRSARK